MKIPEKENLRIVELFQQIRQRQECDNEHTNYKDAHALHEMATLIRPYIAKMEEVDADTLVDLVAVCRFLGESYQEMLRGTYAAEFFTAAFLAAARNGNEDEDLLHNAVKTRNWYIDDACEDLKQAACRVMDVVKAETIIAKSCKRTLKRDPVEMTPEYLAVIDEVEKKVAENMTTHGRGSCHERWSLTREFLEEKDIQWRSQGVMNPGWRFD